MKVISNNLMTSVDDILHNCMSAEQSLEEWLMSWKGMHEQS
jgi:hypothetical protein